MTLTPQDVQNKVFSPTRFRTGYNEDEVDSFLDEVEAELTKLLDENSDLRRQLDEARRGGGGVPPQLLDENNQLRRQLEEARRAAAQAQAQAQAARDRPGAPPPPPATQAMPAAPAPVPAPVRPGSPAGDADIEQRVARTLVLAQRTADEAMREARGEADRARREARADSDRIIGEARAHVAEQLGGLEDDKRRLEGQVEQLRAFEREYRTRLRAYLEMQLRDLDGMPTQPAVAAGGPQRTQIAGPPPGSHLGGPGGPGGPPQGPGGPGQPGPGLAQGQPPGPGQPQGPGGPHGGQGFQPGPPLPAGVAGRADGGPQRPDVDPRRDSGMPDY